MPVAAGNSTAATREWAMRHLDQSLSVPELARHGRMRVRTRRFRAEVGESPVQWIIAHSALLR
jgi:transcriptional regulator GlxA family with amidase domain